ncbi:hypothetical protein RUM43_012314 [Polyplax serrata]|uniref:Uncharacterized protein n=1 Tax=Polyplax serrata TaxID=468196 RepID=A0AAN8S092_POLSC
MVDIEVVESRCDVRRSVEKIAGARIFLEGQRSSSRVSAYFSGHSSEAICPSYSQEIGGNKTKPSKTPFSGAA